MVVLLLRRVVEQTNEPAAFLATLSRFFSLLSLYHYFRVCMA
jgi:hypothetical protein